MNRRDNILRMTTVLLPLAIPLLIPHLTLNAADVPRAILDLALEPPVVNTKPGPEYDDHALLRAVGGTLLDERGSEARGF